MHVYEMARLRTVTMKFDHSIFLCEATQRGITDAYG